MHNQLAIPADACDQAEVRTSPCAPEGYLYCKKHVCGINPTGYTCGLCKKGLFPVKATAQVVAQVTAQVGVATPIVAKPSINIALPPCALRGAKIGDRECPTCGSKKVRLAVFACELHADGVTYQDCRTHRLGEYAQCLPISLKGVANA